MTSFFPNEEARLNAFPILRKQLFLGHAGVTVLPLTVAKAMQSQVHDSCHDYQDFEDALKIIGETRVLAAKLIHAEPDEIALLGPTALGLSLFANGIDWKPGDEVICYQDDYPSNVYPWLNLQSQGVEIKFLQPAHAGEITVDLVQSALTPKTRMVALASCHYLTGYRIDIEGIGSLLSERNILFSLDAIQTVGAFPTPAPSVDFLSADAHKWLLGPMAIGIVYVAKKHFETCHPTLLGAWNVRSPQFISQDEIQFVEGGQRYEPGVLNTTGVYGMHAALRMLLEIGMDRISQRLLTLHCYLREGLEDLGFQSISPTHPKAQSAILTVFHPQTEMAKLNQALEANKITASLRHDRQGQAYIRFSPHFYNTEDDMDRVIHTLKLALAH